MTPSATTNQRLWLTASPRPIRPSRRKDSHAPEGPPDPAPRRRRNSGVPRRAAVHGVGRRQDEMALQAGAEGQPLRERPHHDDPPYRRHDDDRTPQEREEAGR